VSRLSWWAGGVSILALVTAPAWALVVTPENDVGSLEPLRRDRPRVPDRAITEGGLKMPKVVVRSGLLADQASPDLQRAPQRLRIDAIGVAAPVVPVGVTHGTTQVPADVDTVGWYGFGGRPGEPGSTLLLAHVSSGTQGPGVFFRLRELAPGDTVKVQMRNGSWAEYEVFARRSYAKEALPGRLFSRTGPEVLILVTCGGRYSEASGRYRDNVVVYAVPRR
jgi:sortase (surface protein transpeptidase)